MHVYSLWVDWETVLFDPLAQCEGEWARTKVILQLGLPWSVRSLTQDADWSNSSVRVGSHFAACGGVMQYVLSLGSGASLAQNSAGMWLGLPSLATVVWNSVPPKEDPWLPDFHTQFQTALAGATAARPGPFPASGFCVYAPSACASISVIMTTGHDRIRGLAVLANPTNHHAEMASFRL